MNIWKKMKKKLFPRSPHTLFFCFVSLHYKHKSSLFRELKMKTKKNSGNLINFSTKTLKKTKNVEPNFGFLFFFSNVHFVLFKKKNFHCFFSPHNNNSSLSFWVAKRGNFHFSLYTKTNTHTHTLAHK